MSSSSIENPSVSTVENTIKSQQSLNPKDLIDDDFIVTALQSPKDRITLIKLEYELEKFVKDPNATRLNFPPMTSYQRLIVHRVAQYFKLEHTAMEIEPQKRTVVLFKTPNTELPAVFFRDMKEQDKEEETSAPTVQFKIMQRQPPKNSINNSNNNDIADIITPLSTVNISKTTTSNTSNTSNGHTNPTPNSNPSPTIKSIEEREEEYAKARARIFNSSAPSANSSSNSEDTPNSNSNPSSATKSLEEREEEYAKTRARIFNTPTQNQSEKSKKTTKPKENGTPERTTPNARPTTAFWTNTTDDYNDYYETPYVYDAPPAYRPYDPYHVPSHMRQPPVSKLQASSTFPYPSYPQHLQSPAPHHTHSPMSHSLPPQQHAMAPMYPHYHNHNHNNGNQYHYYNNQGGNSYRKKAGGGSAGYFSSYSNGNGYPPT